MNEEVIYVTEISVPEFDNERQVPEPEPFATGAFRMSTQKETR